MTTQAIGRPLFWLGCIGLLATCFYAVYAGPNAARKLESEVRAAAAAALQSGGHDWASLEVDGQKAVLAGVVSDERLRDSAVADVLGAIGAGGVVQGGVTKVLSSGVEVAPVMAPYAWGAQKEGGAVIIAGAAPSRASMNAILGAAHALYGDTVVNRMTLASGAPEGVDWALAASIGLEALRDLRPGAAELVDGRLTLTGSVQTEEQLSRVDAVLARLGRGVTGVSEVAGPAEWTAEILGGRLSLSGLVADDAVRSALIAALKDRFTGEVVDAATLGQTGPWSRAAAGAMPHFARFRSGRFTARGNVLRITGEATESVIDQLKEDLAPFGPDIAVRYTLKAVAPDLPELEGVDLSEAAADLQSSCQQAFQRIMAENTILFESGSARISRQSGLTLDKLVEVARRCDAFRLEVGGHTDNRGRRLSNLRLSNDRAAAVRAYLEAKGLPGDQLTAVGYGPDRPAVTNTTERGRAQNRRIEFTISPVEDR